MEFKQILSMVGRVRALKEFKIIVFLVLTESGR